MVRAGTISGEFPSETVEYQLDRRATALRKAGDLNGAIEVLLRRKDMLGVQWADDKLAKYLQHAGRFDESLVEIQWLLDNSQARIRAIAAHQTPSSQQAGHATFSAHIHRAAALICKREGRTDLEAQHAERARRYMAISKHLQPIVRAEAKAKREDWKAAVRDGPTAIRAFFEKWPRSNA